MRSLVWAYGRHLNRTVDFLAKAFENAGYDIHPLSLKVSRWRKILPILKTLQYSQGRVRAYSSLHPDTYRHVKLPHEWRNWPVFMFGDGTVLSEAPHYFYRDLDYRTVIEFREAGEPTFMYDHFPMSLLRTLSEAQDRVFQEAAAIFTMSHWIRKKMIEHGVPEDRVHWVGAGANMELSMDGNPYTVANLERGQLLFVGRDFIRKGGQLVLNAWPEVRSAVPHAQLVIIGPEAPSVVPAGVSFLGDQPATVVARYLQQSTAFVLPSYWEAYGIAFLEAMAYGVPVIGMDRMAMPEFIRQGVTGRLISSPNVDELQEAMISLLNNPDATWYMSREAYQQAKEYQWARVQERIEEVLDRHG